MSESPETTQDENRAAQESAACEGVFQRITAPWKMPEDDFENIGILLAVGVWFLPLLPLVLLGCMPILAALRIRVLLRMTLLDFLIFSAAVGNVWGLCVKTIGWETPERVLLLVFATLEGVSMIVCGVGWAIRTAESLQQTNLARLLTLILGVAIGPATCCALAGMVGGYYMDTTLAPLVFCAGLLALILIYSAAHRLHTKASAVRKAPTKVLMRELAAARIEERRALKAARNRRKRRKKKRTRRSEIAFRQ